LDGFVPPSDTKDGVLRRILVPLEIALSSENGVRGELEDEELERCPERGSEVVVSAGRGNR
jgi:hypothetical protein